MDIVKYCFRKGVSGAMNFLEEYDKIDDVQNRNGPESIRLKIVEHR